MSEPGPPKGFRPCGCGCGKMVPRATRGGAVYVNATHEARAKNRRNRRGRQSGRGEV